MYEKMIATLAEIVDRFLLYLTNEHPVIMLFIVMGYVFLFVFSLIFVKECFRFNTVLSAQKEIYAAITRAGKRKPIIEKIR